MEDICGTQRRLKGSELKLCKGQDLDFIVKAQRVGRHDDVKVQERVLADAEGLSWGNCSCTHNMYRWLSECCLKGPQLFFAEQPSTAKKATVLKAAERCTTLRFAVLYLVSTNAKSPPKNAKSTQAATLSLASATATQDCITPAIAGSAWGIACLYPARRSDGCSPYPKPTQHALACLA